ncbi:MAG: peptidyl-prolyl cis-trans isomerase [Lysobacteraceae bacterium]|nr:peptidyl-prolyl cis-trans isomerase [Silanimonas sp.]
MLQTFRKFTTGWVAWTIVILIVFAMSFFGIESYLQTHIPTYAAKLDSPPSWWRDAPGEGALGRIARATVWETHEIDQREFRQRFDRFRQQVRASAGDNYDAVRMESVETKREVLDSMIDEKVLEIAARRDGIAVSPEQIRKAILDVEGITQDGTYIGDDAYRIWLQSRGLTAASFEALIAGGLLIGAMPDAVQASGLVGDAELDHLLKLQGETRDIQFVEVTPPAEASPAPTEDELAAWHRSNAPRYSTQESVAMSWVELDASALPMPSEPTEEALRARYEAERSRFGTEEERVAAHILVSLPAGADDAAVEAARAKAEGIAAQARAEGADFAALAAAQSDDAGSKSIGGDLGPIGRDVFPKPFEDAVFALQAGQVSDPVRTDEGWHVIKLTALQPGTVQPFEAVRDQLLAEHADVERERLFTERQGQLVDAILRDPNSIAGVARSVGLEVREGLRFTRTAGEGIAAEGKIRDAAFARPQKDDRIVSDPIELGPNRVVVLQVTDHQPAALRPLEEVREQVRADFEADRSAKAARARAEALLARAKKGEALEALATEIGGVVQDSAGIARSAGFPDPAIATEAFRLKPLVAGEPADVGLAAMSGGRYALVVATAVKSGDLSQFSPQIRTQLRDQLARLRAETERQAFVKALRDQFEVTVAEERL